jgi:hypothetical protein
MEIVEEVTRRRQTLALDNPQTTYSEVRDLLERRMSFDEVREEKYFNDVEEGTIRSRIITTEYYDQYSREEIEIYLYISKQSREMDLQIKAKLITHYATEGWKNTLWYYAYRALYEKFLYGQVRHEYEPAVEQKADQLLTRVRDNVEAKAKQDG